MLNLRIYRAAFAPVLLALIVVAFSLGDRGAGIGTTLAPDAFDGRRAMADVDRLAERYPVRTPGGAADVALAREIQASLRQALVPDASGGPSPVTVRRFADRARTRAGKRTVHTVVAERPGADDHRIVVVADRSATGHGARAELTATAGLLELARVFSGRTTRRTLTLVSTSGGPAGARALVRHLGGPVDAALVLGDLGSGQLRSPQVLAWSNDQGRASERLVRTVGGALRVETGTDPGSPRALVQWARLAAPATLTAQGELLEAGIPAVMLQRSGELGPAPGAGVSGARVEAYGRAALRSIGALDNGPLVPREADTGLLVQRKVLPAWAVSLFVGVLLLPLLVATVDGLARVRRRRQPVGMWLRWVLAEAVPFLVAGLFAVFLRLTGLLAAAPGAPSAGGPDLQPAALAAVVLVLVLGWIGLRPLLLRALDVKGTPGTPGAAAALAIVLSLTAVAVWAVNPYAAALLVPAAHLWVLVAAPEVRLRRPVALLAVLAGLVPPALVALHYADAFDLGPLELAWSLLLAVAGGHVGLLSVVAWSLVLGCAAATATIVLRRRPAESPAPSVTVRGPLTYAGPGSLGGTESALRR